MAENLLKYAIDKEGQQSQILSTANIHTLINNTNFIAKAINEKGEKNIEYLRRIEKLERQSKSFEKLEQKIYDHYGVDDITGLQRKLDTINQALQPFQNKVLSNFQLVKDIASNSVTWEQLEEETLDALQDQYLNTKGKNKQEKLDKVFESFINDLQMARYTTKGIDASKIQKSTIVNAFVPKKGGLTIKKGALKGYKKELKYMFHSKDTPKGATLTLIADVKDAVDTELDYYPYYNLTAEQKKQAKQDNEIWKAFSKKLRNLISDQHTRQVAMEILNSGLITPEDFFVDSVSELKGILGEFQTLVLFAALEDNFNPKDGYLKFIGNVRNAQGEKIGIDIALYGAGIQVKNYNTYGSILKKNEGLNLSNTLTLENFMGKLQGALEQDRIQTLEDYYTMQAYHVKVNKDFKNTQKRIELVNNRLANYFSAYINYFLPLNEISIEATEETEKFSGRNLFYFIGGRRLLPVSKILHHYAEYLRRLLDGVLGEAKRSFFVTSKYDGSGGTYKDYWNSIKKGTSEDYLSDFSYKNIYSGINMKYTANINIDYILDDVLTALERE